MLQDSDLLSIQEVRTLVLRAHEAQKQYERLGQSRIDAIVKAMADAALAQSERLAQMAVEETGFGVAADKHIKNTFVCTNLAGFIAPLRTIGEISEDPVRRVVEIAVPMGVVAAVIPTTNPTSTAIFKCLISLKAGNGVVLSPHPKAVRCIAEAARVCSEAAVDAGAPDGIIGCMTRPTLDATNELMRHRKVAVILATGGTGLVRAAYSSGKPAFGVGPGNVPAYVDRTADVPKAVRDIFTGKTFDNGTLCSSEQSIVVDAPVEAQAVAEMVRLGGHILSTAEAARLQDYAISEDGGLNAEIVGKSAQWIASRAGVAVPQGTRVLVVRLSGVGREHPLSCEKLSPILSFYTVNGWQEGCERCKEILAYGGMGHTLAVHCKDDAVIRRFGLEKPASRICVNTPSTHGSIGYTTALPPSLTLGCGTFGNNVTTDNITPLHLVQIKRLAWEHNEVFPSWYSQVGPGQQTPSSPAQVRAVPVAAGFPAVRPEIVPPQPAVDFVCEADVRSAISEGRRIVVDAETIITPAARDLSSDSDVFHWV